MNSEPEQPSEIEFDPDDGLHRLRECDRCGLPPRAWFHLCRTLVTIGGLAYPSVFYMTRIMHGCEVCFVLRKALYSIMVTGDTTHGIRILLRRSASDRVDHQWEALFYGEDDALHWQQVLRACAYSEHTSIHIDHSGNLAREWTEWQRAQRGRD
jgi:hypothetical protein